ncbi:diguanylate cyclase [Paenibacillus sp. LMG 31456]|uniref:Diguanylate cyclase n=1 Tax=Paenibacillus foliorum TaxID=2654974 RepID=A0A972GQT9_9BACL|nr:diguanylate cyclase [Paenibacillus foliorum]NOU95149.1 diguanylate cyclase [Paenibacillus foliorum]
MVNDFVINAAILIASFFIIGQLFRKYPLHRTSLLNTQIWIGICYGLQGILLMVYTIRLDALTIMDLRHIPIMIAALQGGLPAALISSFIVALARIGLFGFSFSSVTAASCMLLIGTGCGLLLNRVKPVKLSFPLLNVASLLVISSTIFINRAHAGLSLSTLQSLLLFYWLVALLCGQLAYYLYLYIYRMNTLFFKLQESEQRYRSLIEKSPDATIVHDSNTILFVNGKGLQLLHAASPKEVIGSSLQQFIHPLYHKEPQQQPHERLNKTAETERIEQKYIRLDGVEIDVEVSMSSISYKEQPAFVTTIRDITDRKITEQKLQQAITALQRLSDLDGLTGIANRRSFDSFLDQSWKIAMKKDEPLSLIMFDADEFKAYNDAYGHQGGDDCLRMLASHTEHALAHSNHMVARYGGEEFAVILCNTDLDVAIGIAEQIRSLIEALAIPHSSSKVCNVVTVSIGVATIMPPFYISPRELIERADSALYRAKIEGRNRVKAYDD